MYRSQHSLNNVSGHFVAWEEDMHETKISHLSLGACNEHQLGVTKVLHSYILYDLQLLSPYHFLGNAKHFFYAASPHSRNTAMSVDLHHDS